MCKTFHRKVYRENGKYQAWAEQYQAQHNLKLTLIRYACGTYIFAMNAWI